MTTYGYARTSTIEQIAGLADQISKLKGAGCIDQSIYREQISSVRMEDRIEFAKVLSVLKTGDVLVFSSLSRAARSMVHMVEIKAKVARAGATIRILDLAIDKATPSGRLTFNLSASIRAERAAVIVDVALRSLNAEHSQLNNFTVHIYSMAKFKKRRHQIRPRSIRAEQIDWTMSRRRRGSILEVKWQRLPVRARLHSSLS